MTVPSAPRPAPVRGNRYIVILAGSGFHGNRANARFATATLFVAMGTSGEVCPAAEFARVISRRGAETPELNLEPTRLSASFDRAVHGPASIVGPAFVRDALAVRAAH